MVKDAADEVRAMFWLREGGVDPWRDIQDVGAAVRWRVRKQVENTKGGPGQARARALGRGGAGKHT